MSKTSSESNERSPVSICMEVAYKEWLMKEIKEYWEELLAAEVLPDERFYQRLIERSPWFGDFEDWCIEMESKQKDSDLWSRFPSNLQEKAYEIACEMDYLFPKKPLCKTFLPILMTSYCFKRGNKQPLVETLFYKDGRYLRFSKRKNLLFTSTIYESYSRLSSTACELSRPSRILSIYVRLILFLTLLLKAKDICNVSWSFYTFECMTRYIKFLGRDANDIISCIDDTYCASFADCGSAQKEKDLKKKISIFLEEKLTEDPLREEICAYAEKIVNEFWSISNKSTKEFPYSFACFVLNLKLACSSDAEDFFESDEGMKDPLWGPYVIENMRATYLTELSRLTSIAAKSCSPLADEFVKRLCQEDLKQENSKNTI